LLRERNRNTPLLLMLGVFWLTNLTFYLGLIRDNPPLALHALHIGIDIVLVLVTVIGGRIVPAFAASAPHGRLQRLQPAAPVPDCCVRCRDESNDSRRKAWRAVVQAAPGGCA
jgi:uncharacterized protein involved in response to NO